MAQISLTFPDGNAREYAAGITPFRSFAWGIGFFFALGSFVFGLVTG